MTWGRRQGRHSAPRRKPTNPTYPKSRSTSPSHVRQNKHGNGCWQTPTWVTPRRRNNPSGNLTFSTALQAAREQTVASSHCGKLRIEAETVAASEGPFRRALRRVPTGRGVIACEDLRAAFS